MARPFLLVAAILSLACPAAATTLQFNTAGDQLAGQGARMLGATETGGQVDTGTARATFLPWGGLGVQSGDDTTYAGGTWQMDSYGANDVIVFEFDRVVRLDAISLAMTDWWDRFDLFVGDDLTYQRSFKADDLSGYDWVSTVLLGAGYQGTRFAIGASEYESCGYSISEGHGCWTENSAFTITGITFSDVELTDIPLPSTAFLLASAAIGFGAIRRHRRQG